MEIWKCKAWFGSPLIISTIHWRAVYLHAPPPPSPSIAADILINLIGCLPISYFASNTGFRSVLLGDWRHDYRLRMVIGAALIQHRRLLEIGKHIKQQMPFSGRCVVRNVALGKHFFFIFKSNDSIICPQNRFYSEIKLFRFKCASIDVVSLRYGLQQ